jgi:hypothetical protein
MSISQIASWLHRHQAESSKLLHALPFPSLMTYQQYSHFFTKQNTGSGRFGLQWLNQKCMCPTRRINTAFFFCGDLAPPASCFDIITDRSFGCAQSKQHYGLALLVSFMTVHGRCGDSWFLVGSLLVSLNKQWHHSPEHSP